MSSSALGPPPLLLSLTRPSLARSTKDMVGVDGKPLVQLPEVLRYQHQVELGKDVRALYDEVAGEIGKSVKASIEDGSARPSYTHIRASLLPALVVELFVADSPRPASLPPPPPATARLRPDPRPGRLYRGVRPFVLRPEP